MAVPLRDTLKDMLSVNSAIKASVERMRKQPVTVQELVATVHYSVERTVTILGNEPELSENAMKSLDELIDRLRDVERHFQDPEFYGSRARSLRKLKKMFVGQEDFCAPYRLALQSALETFESDGIALSDVLSLSALTTAAHIDATTKDISDEGSQAILPQSETVPKVSAAGQHRQGGAPRDTQIMSRNTAGDIPAVGEIKKATKSNTVMDAIETGLRTVANVTDFIPGPAGPIVKLMAGTGLSIIDILNGISDNRHEALALGRHVGVLVQTVFSFLEVPASGQQATVDSETENQLQAFLGALKSVESSLRQLQTQSDFKQGVSYQSNKTDLQGWDTEVKRAFDQLQNRLSLNAIRMLTNMNEVDALRERDRLLDRLGDGATGVASKGNEETDIMCCPETRMVVLDEIGRWLKDPSGERILWISGVAGCGKSAVAATIPHQHQEAISSTIFYLNRGTQQRNERVVCSLARQLARLGHGSLERTILEVVKAQPDISTSLLATQFQNLLVNPLRKLVPGSPLVLILVDGLDEWENHAAASKLVELIGRAHAQLPSTVRFVIASRNEHHLVSSIFTAEMLPLVKRYELDKVPPNDALHDVRVYLEKRFSAIRSKSTDAVISKGDWPGNINITVLVNLSAGLFQWASTVMKHIEQRSSNVRLRRILDAPEQFRDLDGLYRGIFNSFILDDTPAFVLQLLPKVLGFIALALVPVNAITITEYCADPSKKETLDDIQEDVIARLASFLILPKSPTGSIRVSHKSVFDFATDPHRCTDPRFYIDAVDHHRRLASMSLALMNRDLKYNICEISNRTTGNKQAQEGQLVYSRISDTLRYACSYWATHLLLGGYDNSTEPSKLLDQFAGSVCMKWVEVMSLCGCIRDRQAALIVEDALSWSQKCAPSAVPTSMTQTLLTDLVHFLDMFQVPITENAAQIYACALPLAPSESKLRRKYSEAVTKCLQTVRCPRYTPITSSFWVGTEFPRIVCMSSDGSIFASASRHDHSIILWNAATGEQHGEALKGHTKIVSCVAFAPDGKTLASGSLDNSIRMWEIAKGSRNVQVVELGISVEGIAFSPDGQNLALAIEYGGFHLVGLEDLGYRVVWRDAEVARAREQGDRERVPSLPPRPPQCRPLRPLIFSSGGTKLACLRANANIRFWDVNAGAEMEMDAPTPYQTSFTSCQFSHSDTKLALGDGMGALHLWDIETGQWSTIASAGIERGPIQRLQISADSKTVATDSLEKRTISLWEPKDWAGGQRKYILKGYAGPSSIAAFSYGARMLACGHVEQVWKLDTEVGRDESVLRGHASLVVCLAFSNDGRTLASGGIDGAICLWDAEIGVQTGYVPSNQRGLPMALHFTEDDSKLVAYHGMRDVGVEAGAGEALQSGEIDRDGWVLHGIFRWFWLPVCGGEWLLHGTCLAVPTGFCVFIFDVSGIMDMIN